MGKCPRIKIIIALSHQRKAMSTRALCLLIACRMHLCVFVIVTLMFLFLIYLVKNFDNKSRDKSSLASMFLLQTMHPAWQGQFDKIGYGQRPVYGFPEYEHERWGGPESNMGGHPGVERIDQSGWYRE
jgi:hypothetical protein